MWVWLRLRRLWRLCRLCRLHRSGGNDILLLRSSIGKNHSGFAPESLLKHSGFAPELQRAASKPLQNVLNPLRNGVQLSFRPAGSLAPPVLLPRRFFFAPPVLSRRRSFRPAGAPVPLLLLRRGEPAARHLLGGAQQSAGGLDVLAARGADGGVDAAGRQRVAEAEHRLLVGREEG